MTDQKIKSAAEALLFVWGEALEAKSMAELFGISTADMLRLLRELAAEYDDRDSGLMIRETDKAFRICTRPEYDDYITRFITPVREKRLSQAALEVLAIVAYKQPVTKSEIDSIRGIRSDRVIEGLMKRELIEEKGRSTSIGRPILYATTRNFLELFGFESLEDLPLIEDLDTLAANDGQLTIPMEGGYIGEAGYAEAGESAENTDQGPK